MDDNNKIGTGTVKKDDLEPYTSNHQTEPLQQPGNTGSDFFLNDSNYYTTPDFLNDNSFSNATTPNYIENNTTTNTITTYVPEPVEPKVQEEVVNKQPQQNENIDYSYNDNLNQNFFNSNEVPTYSGTEYQAPTTNTYEYSEVSQVNPIVNNYHEVKDNTQNNFLQWLAAIFIFLILLVLAFLGFNFISQNLNSDGQIAGISDQTLISDGVSLLDEIKKYHEFIKSNPSNFASTNNTEASFWNQVNMKGKVLLDKILKLIQKAENYTFVSDDERKLIEEFLVSSKEFVSFHVKLSEIFIYLNEDINLMTQSTSTQSNFRIDKIRAAINNAKGELTELLETQVDLRKERIFGFYNNSLNNLNKNLVNLKEALELNNSNQINSELTKIKKIYTEEERFFEETKFFIDYSKNKSVKYFFEQSNQTT